MPTSFLTILSGPLLGPAVGNQGLAALMSARFMGTHLTHATLNNV